jgi:uncharacterized protein DUF2252
MLGRAKGRPKTRPCPVTPEHVTRARRQETESPHEFLTCFPKPPNGTSGQHYSGALQNPAPRGSHGAQEKRPLEKHKPAHAEAADGSAETSTTRRGRSTPTPGLLPEVAQMDITESTKRYEEWLTSNTSIDQKHLRRKHKSMRKNLFGFLRATFYRWIQIWPQICSDLTSAPNVLAVGDLHVENFGTWRDHEGRLVWGVNDFDETFPLPYTNDLVRLTAGALLAIADNQLELKPKNACEAILSGYTQGLKSGGQPFVLEEYHKSLRTMAFGRLRGPRRFWEKLLSEEKLKGNVPRAVSEIFDEVMPPSKSPYQLFSRVSGLGSLGRVRIVAVADCSGGKIAREVKALAPSACVWMGNGGTNKIRYQTVLKSAIRCRDPFVQVKERWLIRRLSPHCCRIELKHIPKTRDEYRLLYAMGYETANIHLGSPDRIGAVRRDLAKRKPAWLRDAAKAMVEATTRDWKDWQNSQ